MSDKKILLVEENNDLRDVLMNSLKTAGYNVYGADSGEAAISEMKKVKPDMVLLDILMSDKDGMDVLEAMHKDENMKNIPVVIMSNSGQPVEIDRAKSLGVRDFIIKTVFDIDEVLKKVREVLGEEKSDSVTSTEGENFKSTTDGNSDGTVDNVGVFASEKTDGGRGNVLIIEDDKFLRELLGRKLSSEGFSVESAIDSKGAFEVLEKWKPSIILLDLILPEEDGFTILGKIKKDKNFSNIPVIILSNLGQQEDIDRASALGAMDFMVKANFTLDEIYSKVSKALLG